MNKIKTCETCKYRQLSLEEEPCKTCDAVFQQTSKIYTQWEAETAEAVAKALQDNNYDQHYISAHQPIETMQSNMTYEEFIGFLKGNIIKYACRLGKKDDAKKEAAKIRRYSEWLEQAVNRKTIDPRK